ncbi:MAG: hypothetical protein K2G37_02775, partial [Clostridia bacterium]|nr:hypothetical protein [Clostridia bacterium]
MMILCLVLSCVLIGQSNLREKANALNSAGLTSATVVGKGVDLWDSSNQKFDGDVADDLINKIFGDEDPHDYVDTYGVDPHNYGSKVVRASYINENIYDTASTSGAKIKNQYGLLVTLGGMKWMVTSVTKDNTADENIVATLYLAGVQSSTAWQSSSSTTKGSNAYSASSLRYALVEDSATAPTWGLFRHSAANDFAEQYLVQPKNINYQLYQNHDDCAGSTGKILPNDALSTPKNSANWGVSNYSSGGSWQLGNWTSAQDYAAWGNDYIWVPSACEVGWSERNATDNIWGLDNNQRMSPSSSWLRSGGTGDYFHACTVLATGASGGNTVGESGGLRPALHLNLSSMLGSAVPEDMEVKYTGSALDIKTAATLDGAKWYTDNLDANIQNGNVKVAYTSGNLTNGVPQNAGTYEVSFTIQNLSANSPFIWKGDDMSDPKIETKTMTLTIKPVELRATWDYTQDTDTEPKVSFTGFVGEETESVLSLTKRYTGRNGTANPTDTSKMPLKIGDYTVEITDLGNTNYTLASGNTYDFHMDSIKVSLPKIRAGTSGDYSDILTFTNWYTYSTSTTNANRSYYLDYDTDKIEISDFGGLTRVSNKIVQGVNAGTYTLTLKLKDKDNMVWSDNTSSSADRTVSIKILSKEIELEVYGTNDGVLTKKVGENLSVSLHLSANMFPKAGDSLSVNIKAVNEDDDSWEYDLYEGLTIDSNGVSGSENFTLELATGQIVLPSNWKLVFTASGNNNYEFRLSEDVTLTMTEEDEDGFIYWRLLVDGLYAEGQLIKVSILDTDNATYKNKLTYNGAEFAFELNRSLPSGWRVDTGYNDNDYTNGYKNKLATNAGEYATSVMLLDGDGVQHEFTIEWNVKKALIDLSDVRWLDDGKLEYKGGATVYAEIDASTLP